MKAYAPLITNLFFILALLVLTYLTVHSLRSWISYRTIQQNGLPVMATIVKKSISRNTKGADYHHVEITYEVDNRTYSKDITVTEAIYSQLHQGTSAQVFYLADNPERVDFQGNTSFYSNLLIIVILDVLAVAFCIFIFFGKSS